MHICLDRRNTGSIPASDMRGIAPRSSIWPPHKRTLTVGFFNGTQKLQDQVFFYAVGWMKHCGIVFDRGYAVDRCDIRIEFADDYAHWSFLGRDAQTVPAQTATMHFGWLEEKMQDFEVRRIVLHEFGHALGLAHEHQNPVGGIQWNRDYIYQVYGGPPNYWPKEMVDVNVLNKYDVDTIKYSQFDCDSIMLYPITKEMTLDGFSVGWNTQISDKDAEFVESLYPKERTVFRG